MPSGLPCRLRGHHGPALSGRSPSHSGRRPTQMPTGGRLHALVWKATSPGAGRRRVAPGQATTTASACSSPQCSCWTERRSQTRSPRRTSNLLRHPREGADSQDSPTHAPEPGASFKGGLRAQPALVGRLDGDAGGREGPEMRLVCPTAVHQGRRDRASTSGGRLQRCGSVGLHPRQRRRR